MIIPNKEALTTLSVYGTALVDQTTQHGIVAAVTSSQISGYVFLGITLGGWVTLLIFISTVIIFIMNLSKFIKFCYIRYKHLKTYLGNRKHANDESFERQQ